MIDVLTEICNKDSKQTNNENFQQNLAFFAAATDSENFII